MVVSIIFTFFCMILFLFITIFNKKFEMLVEKENDFWVKRKLMSTKNAERLKRFEKSTFFKVLMFIYMCIGFFSIWYLS